MTSNSNQTSDVAAVRMELTRRSVMEDGSQHEDRCDIWIACAPGGLKCLLSNDAQGSRDEGAVMVLTTGRDETDLRRAARARLRQKLQAGYEISNPDEWDQHSLASVEAIKAEIRGDKSYPSGDGLAHSNESGLFVMNL